MESKPHSVRSKACNTCRKRRVKCDERSPFCRNCLVMGLDCSGPAKGPIFIDMTRKYAATSSSVRCKPRKSQESKSLDLVPPPVIQFEDLCFYQFLEAMLSKRPPKLKPWLAYLNVPSSACSYPALSPAVRAASIMFYGISRQDIRARTTAHYWYEVSLSSHRSQLQGFAGHDGQTMISGLISCSLVLALFEVISSTEPSGSFHHYAAAATLLEMVGPTNCQSGMMHQMFRTIRLNAAYISMMTGKPSAFCSDEWLTVPFAQNPKTAFDTVVNALVSITYCSSLLHDAKVAKACGEPRKETAFRMNVIREKALDVISQLDDWYAQYEERISTALLPTPEATPGSDGSPCFLSDPIYPDTLTASIVGLYNAANVVACSILTSITSISQDQRSTFRDRALSHCASILSVAGFQEWTRTAGGDFMRTAYPLRIVAALSPSTQQTIDARKSLARWAELSSFNGIGAAYNMPDYLKVD